MFDVLSATSPEHHLRVFSTLLCLFSSSSNFLLSCYPLISPYMPPISELAALVSFCPPHVTQPLSCVVCLNSTILPLSALVTLTIFRTQFFPHTCSLCCCSSVRCPLVFWRSASPPSPPQPLSTRSLRPVLFDIPPLSLSLSLYIYIYFRISVSAQSSPHNLHRVLNILLDSSQCLAQLTLARVGIARSVHVQLGASTRHKMRHSLSLPTVTCICMRELPHFYNGPTMSFLHSQPIQTPPSGPGLIGAAGQVFIWDDPSATPLS